MKKVITINDFVDELIDRIDKHKDIDCCDKEIKNFALMAKEKMGSDMIEVEWKD